MSEPGPGDELQFERAKKGDAAAAVITCGVCNEGIESEYYESGGGIVCPGCRAARIAERDRGSRWGRMARRVSPP